MMRSSIARQLTAGPLINLNLENFGKVFRAFKELFLVDGKLEILVECIIGVIFMTGTTIKYIQNLCMEHKLRHIYKRFTNDWKQMENKREKEVLRKSWKLGYTFTLIFIVYLIQNLIIFVTMPIMGPKIFDTIISTNESRPKLFIIYTEYFVDEQEYYWYIYAHSFIVSILVTFIIAAADTMYANCVCHCIGLYDVLKYRMDQTFEMTRDKFKCDSKFEEERIHAYIIQTIKLHNQTIEFRTIIISSNRYIVMWLGHFIYLFYTCWPGQKLVDKNVEFFMSLYFCGWYKLPIKTRYLIHLMMMRSSIARQLTAGPLINLNLENFGKVTKEKDQAITPSKKLRLVWRL
ncbi:uncharacterized protein LOC106642416 [Copidosoma floridanum]|uniref:uncharacterized protein LOC106642416 n=1 Tax=Copidosoma floridanum TaxID=29053 RepID=UPI0006C9AD9D|nr:uncharacterized protein LOC106642416 [Copidosoma floridanum]